MNMFAFILVIWLVGCQQTASAQNMCICLKPFPSKDKPFNQTVHMASANDGSKRIFLVDLAGFVWIVKKGKILSKPFANITSDVDQSKKETGLQTIAFHPGFKTNKKIYLFYTAKQTPVGNTTRLVVEEFRVKDGDNNTIDTTAFRRLLLQFDAQDVFHFGGKVFTLPTLKSCDMFV
ncbi:hypothetical protein DPMN_118467 [Dreissena polymorpha]|uniref:Glucose/Sorbosone dehydrogenase domain-containing protein n=1 Tax=Dreissena polymorpha TaxID=45954 RepID=A0A9D4GHG4_DREPO|nr:hypothetical protein DPMN_118467 [Dreissena polymorpha]